MLSSVLVGGYSGVVFLAIDCSLRLRSFKTKAPRRNAAPRARAPRLCGAYPTRRNGLLACCLSPRAEARVAEAPV
jgi:hypothetical protein